MELGKEDKDFLEGLVKQFGKSRVMQAVQMCKHLCDLFSNEQLEHLIIPLLQAGIAFGGREEEDAGVS